MKKRKIRSSLYFFLAALFLFGATLVAIIISQGGSVTEDGFLTNTGVLRINVDPADTPFTLYIDDKQVENLVNKGTNVTAGVHTIRIEAAGMNSWGKKINITQGIVSDILAKLFPLELNLEQITNSNINKVAFSASGDFIFYVVKDTAVIADQGIWRLQLNPSGIFFFNTNTLPTKFAELDPDILPLLADDSLSMLPSPDNNKMLLVSPANKELFLLNNLNGNEAIKVIDIVSELGYFPRKTEWLNDSISLLVDEGNMLFEYDLTNKRSTLIKYDPQLPVIYGHNSLHVIWFDPLNKSLIQYKNQANLALQFPELILPEQILSIRLPQNNSRFVFLETETDYVLLDLDKKTSLTLGMDPKTHNLIDISADATTYLFKNNEMKLISFTSIENIALDKLDTKIYEFPLILSEIDTVSFAPQRANILIYKPQENSVYTVDYDGSNQIALLTSTGLTPYFGFDYQLGSLYLLMQDSPLDTTTPETTSNNIYKIDLKLAN